MRFLLFLSSASLVLGLTGTSLLVAHVEWIHAQHNFWAIRNPSFHVQVLLTLLTTPLFWIFLGAWVLGYCSMSAIEKREVRARQNILRNVEQLSGEVKSAAFVFSPQGEFKQIHESIEQKIRTIQEALGKGQKIDFGYEKHNGQLSDRIVTPFRLTNLGQNPSLEGYCHLRESNRVFLVAGMSDITIISPRKNAPQQQFTPQSAQPSRRDYALLTSDAHSISDCPELVDRNVRASEILPGSSPTRPYMRCRIDELKKIAYEHWNSVSGLTTIQHELDLRYGQQSGRLNREIKLRIKELPVSGFRWPTTAANVGAESLSVEVFQTRQGLLKFCGYKVGANGCSAVTRCKILDDVFLKRLPNLDDTDYLAEWGSPNSATRLKKLSETIAAFARNAKRRDSSNLKQAIRDWESDLAYLKRAYYDGRFDFRWPRTGSSD